MSSKKQGHVYRLNGVKWDVEYNTYSEFYSANWDKLVSTLQKFFGMMECDAEDSAQRVFEKLWKGENYFNQQEVMPEDKLYHLTGKPLKASTKYWFNNVIWSHLGNVYEEIQRDRLTFASELVMMDSDNRDEGDDAWLRELDDTSPFGGSPETLYRFRELKVKVVEAFDGDETLQRLFVNILDGYQHRRNIEVLGIPKSNYYRMFSENKSKFEAVARESLDSALEL